MARKFHGLYERIFFDRLLFVGIVMLACSYVLRHSWGGAFAEAATIILGILWSYRAATTHKSRVLRLLAALILVLIGILLAFYLGSAYGLTGTG